MQNRFTGRCRCGATVYSIALPKGLDAYVPRACDCDYCTKRQVSYLSAPDASIRLQSESAFRREQQGSEQATFLICNACNDLVAVVCEFGDQLLGAVNASLLLHREQLPAPAAVSPKHLKPDEKRSRWTTVWARVDIAAGTGA